MSINVWSKVAVAVQTLLAAPRTITAITRANPAVATSTAHAYANGALVLLKIQGMSQLDFAIVRVAATAANTFNLEGIDSTAFDTFTSGTAELITFGANATTFQDVNGDGGVAAPISITTIHNDQEFDIPGNRSPITYSFGSLWRPADPALLALRAFDDLKSACCIQMRFSTTAVVLMVAFPSCPLIPIGSAGQAVTTPVSLRLAGRLTTYPTSV